MGMGEDRQRSDTAVLDPPGMAVRPLRVGITGHTDLGWATIRLVAYALREQLRRLRRDPSEPRPPLIGVSCLAPGADCVFAAVVLHLGGELEVILPSADYADSQVSKRHALVFTRLLRRASSVRTAVPPGEETGPRAYAAANDLMLDSVDRLFAVWNGAGPAVLGGTAHAVSAAEKRQLPVTVIWPEGSRRG
jgi:hypothetical protein